MPKGNDINWAALFDWFNGFRFSSLGVFKGKAYENKLTTTIERSKNDIRQEMEQIERKTYENSIETTHVCDTARSDSTIYR